MSYLEIFCLLTVALAVLRAVSDLIDGNRDAGRLFDWGELFWRTVLVGVFMVLIALPLIAIISGVMAVLWPQVFTHIDPTTFMEGFVYGAVTPAPYYGIVVLATAAHYLPYWIISMNLCKGSLQD